MSFLCCPFSHEMSWMRSGTEFSQFLRLFLPSHYLHHEKGVCPKDDSYSQSVMKYSNVITYGKKKNGCSFNRTTRKLQSKPQTDDVSGQTQKCTFLLFHFLSPCLFMSFSYILSITYPAREIIQNFKYACFYSLTSIKIYV